MDYELAKKLKDAGFPMIERVDESPRERLFIQNVGWKNRLDIVFAPTLSELIAACGHDFKSLNFYDENLWVAVSEKTGPCGSLSPEEAVANLWLALNEKNP